MPDSEEWYRSNEGSRGLGLSSGLVGCACCRWWLEHVAWCPPAHPCLLTARPTNSGKTHQALQDLRAAPTGLYCGPLRLLAWQVYDQLASGGLPCNLVTGQERREVGAAHTACTTEMASVRSVVDVAVVDEIQMLADANRGWAFTRALLGVPARTLHVCGDPAVLPLLRRIAQETGALTDGWVDAWLDLSTGRNSA